MENKNNLEKSKETHWGAGMCKEPQSDIIIANLAKESLERSGQNMQHSAFPPPRPGWKYCLTLSSTVLDFAVQMGSGNPR